MRGSASLAILALLTGCGGGGPAPLPTGRITAYFPAGGVADTIVIDVVDRLALRRAELVAPDGQTTAATSIAARPASDSAALALPTGAYASGGAALGAVVGNPPNTGAVGAAVQTQSRLLTTVSTAAIGLPDPIAYRRAWQQYRIRLRLGDPPGAETREIVGPEPPPAATSPEEQTPRR